MFATTLKCPNCGNNVDRSDKVCPYCRQTLFHASATRTGRRAVRATMQCRNCGNPITRGMDVCPYCRQPTRQQRGARRPPIGTSTMGLLGVVGVLALTAGLGLLMMNALGASIGQWGLTGALIAGGIGLIRIVRRYRPPT